MSSADNTDSKISTKLQLPLIGLEHFTSYKEKIYILRLYFVAHRVTLLPKILGSPTKLDGKYEFTQVGIQSTLSDFQPTGSDEPQKGLFTP